MDESTFWEVIECSFEHIDVDECLEIYESRLEQFEPDEVIEFQRVLNRVMGRGCHWNLIGAACFLGCGQSDDGFEDFRAWLIAQGRETFERVLADPEILATMEYDESPTEEWHLEELHMLPGEVGGEEDSDDWPYLEDPRPPAGERVEISKTALQLRFPRLWEQFGSRFMIGIPD